MSEASSLLRLRELERGTTTQQALDFFDSLPAAPLELMLGAWKGSGLHTHHPLDGMLERFGWHGKRFAGPEDVHPLVFANPAGQLFSVNPALVPMGLVVRYAALFKRPIVARIFKRASIILRTSKPKARLRLSEYRGVSSATMIYDALPINDIFRVVDQNTLLGIMDLRGVTQPFVFVLRREL